MTTEKANSIGVGATTLELPAYFPAVSSLKTGLKPLDYVRALLALNPINSRFLVSAFDLLRADEKTQAELQALLIRAQENNCVVAMDSGNYEAFWKDSGAEWTRKDFCTALSRFPCSFAFAFDNQAPLEDAKTHKIDLVDQYRLDHENDGGVPIIPIIHAQASSLPELCGYVAECSKASMVAVPERRLGDGIYDRARTVGAIRKALDDTGRRVALHLLGTGNPISIAIYVATGANSFDGLEWCQTVVDHETALLFHLSQADFFRGQTDWDNVSEFHPRTLAHNLEFYARWMRRLREAVLSDAVVDFCHVHFPDRVYTRCVAELGWGQ